MVLSYKYYDTPDGEDVFKKTVAFGKWGLGLGLTISTYDVLMYTQPKGVFNTLGRYAYFTGPALAMATAFTVTSHVSQKIRGKNDKINYLLGGIVVGGIYSGWQRSPVSFVPAAVIFGTIAVLKKMSVDDGWEFFPMVGHMSKCAKSARYDYTLTEDLPKSWTTTDLKE